MKNKLSYGVLFMVKENSRDESNFAFYEYKKDAENFAEELQYIYKDSLMYLSVIKMSAYNQII